MDAQKQVLLYSLHYKIVTSYTTGIFLCFYIAQYPVCWTAQSALHFTPWQTRSFRLQLYFSGKHSTMLQLLPEDYWLAFHTISIARYSFIQLSELGRHAENESAQASEKNSEGHSNPGSLDCESDILPLSYFAPHKVTLYTIEASSLMSQKLKKFKKSQIPPTHFQSIFGFFEFFFIYVASKLTCKSCCWSCIWTWWAFSCCCSCWCSCCSCNCCCSSCWSCCCNTSCACSCCFCCCRWRCCCSCTACGGSPSAATTWPWPAALHTATSGSDAVKWLSEMTRWSDALAKWDSELHGEVAVWIDTVKWHSEMKRWSDMVKWHGEVTRWSDTVKWHGEMTWWIIWWITWWRDTVK